MTIRFPDILNHPIPMGRQCVSPNVAALYALSVGLAQDPLDAIQLSFVDPTNPQMQLLPFMGVVLAPHGFWMSDPATGIDAVKLVHGEQSIALHRAVPLNGDVIGRSRIVDVIDKGEGKGALLMQEKELVDAASGDLIATLRSTVFLRGNGGFGGPARASPPAHPMPATSPDVVVDLPTRPEQALYYRLNGDVNPLHSDLATAARAGYPRPILHGLCTFGLCGHAVLRVFCDYRPERLRSMGMRFTSAVFPGETVTVELWRDGSFRARVRQRDVVVIDHGHAVFEETAGEPQ